MIGSSGEDKRELVAGLCRAANDEGERRTVANVSCVAPESKGMLSGGRQAHWLDRHRMGHRSCC